MPRKTRRQFVGKQEDVEQQEREDALRILASDLHRLQVAKKKNPSLSEIEPTEDLVFLPQAEIKILTVHS